MQIRRQNDETSSNECLIFMSPEYLIYLQNSTTILCKSNHLPWRYGRKRACFSRTQCITQCRQCHNLWQSYWMHKML